MEGKKQKESEMVEELYKIIRYNMKNFRLKGKLTQGDLAKSLGISTHHYQQIEAGNNPPNLKIVYSMSKLFKVHPIHFFNTYDFHYADQEGKIVTRELSFEDLEAVKKFSSLSKEDKRSVIDFINFKYEESWQRIKEERKKKKGKSDLFKERFSL